MHILLLLLASVSASAEDVLVVPIHGNYLRVNFHIADHACRYGLELDGSPLSSGSEVGHFFVKNARSSCDDHARIETLLEDQVKKAQLLDRPLNIRIDKMAPQIADDQATFGERDASFMEDLIEINGNGGTGEHVELVKPTFTERDFKNLANTVKGWFSRGPAPGPDKAQ